MDEIDKLAQRLDEMGVISVRGFPGTQPSTPEQVAAEINRILDALERGDYEEVTDEEI